MIKFLILAQSIYSVVCFQNLFWAVFRCTYVILLFFHCPIIFRSVRRVFVFVIVSSFFPLLIQHVINIQERCGLMFIRKIYWCCIYSVLFCGIYHTVDDKCFIVLTFVYARWLFKLDYLTSVFVEHCLFIELREKSRTDGVALIEGSCR